MITEQEITDAAVEYANEDFFLECGFSAGATWAQEKLKPVKTTGIEKDMARQESLLNARAFGPGKLNYVVQIFSKRSIVANQILIGGLTQAQAKSLEQEFEYLNNQLREYLGL